jgi:hypothetical protein
MFIEKAAFAILCGFTVLGCAPTSSSSAMRDTQTIHDPNATRVWLVHDSNGLEPLSQIDLHPLLPDADVIHHHGPWSDGAAGACLVVEQQVHRRFCDFSRRA